MTDNTESEYDWDDDLRNLADGLLNDAGADGVPLDVVDGPRDVVDGPAAGAEGTDGESVPADDTATMLAERTLDLQRLQAEYVNYKRRVDRDRDVARQRGVEAVMADLLPVLDGIDAARSHDELTGGAAMMADELAKVAAKYGLEAYGAEGDPFDPHIHEALMHLDKPGYPVMSVAQVFQRGYRLGDRIVRPARVGVADADPAVTPEAHVGSDE